MGNVGACVCVLSIFSTWYNNKSNINNFNLFRQNIKTLEYVECMHLEISRICKNFLERASYIYMVASS